MTPLASVVLAAGRGKRLRPLTDIRPKPLCPIVHTTLLDLAIEEVARLAGPVDADHVAVNAHHLAEQIAIDVGDRAHLSVERQEALGTAGALGKLRAWIDRRPVLVRNGDVWRGGTVSRSFVEEWDGARPRLLVVEDPGRADFGGRWRFAGLSLLAWTDVCGIDPVPAGLYEAVWAPAEAAGRLDLVVTTDDFIDCGTPRDYLRANLLANGGASVIGVGADIRGEVVRSVVWPGGVVEAGERLVDAIRVGAALTVR